jgi:hypothetical protein
MSDNLREQILAAYESQESDEPEIIEKEIEEDSGEEPEEAISISDIQEESSDGYNAPKNWAAEDKAAFEELDEKSRKLYLKRYKEMEGGFTKKTQGLAEERKVAENFKKAISSHEEHLRNLGVDPFQAVDKLLATERLFRTGTPGQKAQALQKLINDYQIQTNIAQQEQQQHQYADPNLNDFREELIRQRQYLAYMQQEKEQQATREVLGVIESFSTAKDKSGDLKHPHFDAVREVMGDLINKQLATDINDAYEKAVILNKDLRNDYILRQNVGNTSLETAKQKTAASKRAGFNVKSGSSSSISDPEAQLDRRAMIAKAYDAQLNRGRI